MRPGTAPRLRFSTSSVPPQSPFGRSARFVISAGISSRKHKGKRSLPATVLVQTGTVIIQAVPQQRTRVREAFVSLTRLGGYGASRSFGGFGQELFDVLPPQQVKTGLAGGPGLYPLWP